MPIAVLISGTGSNLQALIDAEAVNRLSATIRVVVSSKDTALGVKRAQNAKIKTEIVRPSDYSTREEHDETLAKLLLRSSVEFVCLAGYTCIVGPRVLEAFPNRVLNIHPSLLPAFPGLNAPQQAMQFGVKITGCTVHIVTDVVDGGPIVAQGAVPVLDGDTTEALAARILAEEHRIYPQVVRWFCERRVHVNGRMVTIDRHPLDDEGDG
ncbi:MAG: phosphoribosylglycinamide formyltransferase [Myxococcales bacterium]|nr:phosphoribosylglycinamide formyltransferase [Myxococcales bacterium]